MPGVRTIADRAAEQPYLGVFEDCKSLRRVEMPAIEHIGIDAFHFCSALEEVIVPTTGDGYTIGARAFFGCSKLSNIDLKKALTMRLDYFCERGCKASDHGMDTIVYREGSTAELDEAFGKAMGTGLVGFEPEDVQLLHKPGGQPYLALSGKAAELARGIEFAVSAAHTKDYATVTVVGERIAPSQVESC